MEKINVMLDSGSFMPVREHTDDAGLDIMTPKRIFVPAHGSCSINTGVHVEIPAGYAGELKSKSGLNMKYDIISTGLIDAGYTGSIRVKLYNLGDGDVIFERGDKITQLVIYPIVTPAPAVAYEFKETERGNNGFGSTGR